MKTLSIPIKVLSTLILMLSVSFFTKSMVLAAGTLTLSQSTALKNGQVISISGSGFGKNSTGTLVECNNDPSQPNVSIAGNAVPVSCTDPLNKLVTTDANGNLPATNLTIITGTTGPAASGKDSSGNDSAADAANYPCPPTATQIAKGDSCVITFGDASGDNLSVNISFAGTHPAPAPPPSSTTPTVQNTPQTTTPVNKVPSKLVNTGPGNLVESFVIVFVAGVSASYLYIYLRERFLKNS